MQRVILSLAALVLLVIAVWLWGLGGANEIGNWAKSGQAAAQQAIAGLLRRLRAGDAAALTGLLGLCFAYGFFHAAGPGHGKLLISGYGVAARVSALRLSTLAVLSSLAQALAAVILVYASVLFFDWTRQHMMGLAEDIMAPASFGAMALIGLWIMFRGLRRLRMLRGAAAIHTHDHAHGHDSPTCTSCGHRHGPSPAEAEAVSDWRDAAMLIGAVAIRPCSGALFLLIMTLAMGLQLAGILGVLAMALGTASVTIVVAMATVIFREGALLRLVTDRGTGVARSLSLLEILAGLAIAGFAIHLMAGAL